MKRFRNMLVGVVALGFTPAVMADIALTNLGPERGGGTPGADTVHGWEFVANDGINVTHLGLFDRNQDGFADRHDIGLFDLASGALLTSGTMSAGMGDPLIAEFRYIDTPDVVLVPGRRYVISYYTDQNGTSDFVITDATFTVNPAIAYVQGRWGGGSGGLAIPPNGTSDTRIGPNFQFGPSCEPCKADLNEDCEVGFGDLLQLLAAWGPCPDFTCPEGGSCDEGFPECDGEGCFCFKLFNGGTFCKVSVSCTDLEPCPNGDCPPGFVCEIETCCPDVNVCVPLSSGCERGAAPTPHAPGTLTDAGIVPGLRAPSPFTPGEFGGIDR